MIISDSMPIQQPLCPISIICFRDALISQFRLMNEEIDDHTQTIGWWDEQTNLIFPDIN